MSVQFDEESFTVPSRPVVGKVGLTGILFKLGIAKNAFAANALLITLSVACFAFALFIWNTSKPASPIGPQVEDFYKQGKQYTPGVPLR